MRLEIFFDELVKLGTISADDARRSMDRLDSLEKSKPNMGQIARYGALGATAGALTKGIGHAIEHGRLPTGRAAIGSAIGGAIGMGAMPLVRHHLDRRAEMGKLREFVREPKQAFAVSQYSGPLSYGPFKMTSGMPPFSAPGLGAGFQKKQDALATVKVSTMLQRGLSPKSMLASSQTVGEAKLTDPTGPSIADLSKPIGFGTKLPGAVKGTL